MALTTTQQLALNNSYRTQLVNAMNAGTITTAQLNSILAAAKAAGAVIDSSTVTMATTNATKNDAAAAKAAQTAVNNDYKAQVVNAMNTGNLTTAQLNTILDAAKAAGAVIDPTILSNATANATKNDAQAAAAQAAAEKAAAEKAVADRAAADAKAAADAQAAAEKAAADAKAASIQAGRAYNADLLNATSQADIDAIKQKAQAAGATLDQGYIDQATKKIQSSADVAAQAAAKTAATAQGVAESQQTAAAANAAQEAQRLADAKARADAILASQQTAAAANADMQAQNAATAQARAQAIADSQAQADAANAAMAAQNAATAQARTDAIAASQTGPVAPTTFDSAAYESALPPVGTEKFNYFVANQFDMTAPDGSLYRAIPTNKVTGEPGRWVKSTDNGRTYVDPTAGTAAVPITNQDITGLIKSNQAVDIKQHQDAVAAAAYESNVRSGFAGRDFSDFINSDFGKLFTVAALASVVGPLIGDALASGTTAADVASTAAGMAESGATAGEIATTLEASGLSAEAAATAAETATGITSGAIDVQALGAANGITADAVTAAASSADPLLAINETVAASGSGAVAPLYELSAAETAELMSGVDPNMISSFVDTGAGAAGTAGGTAGSILSGSSLNPITNLVTNLGVTNPVAVGALTGAGTSAVINAVTGQPINPNSLLMGALGGGVAGGIGSVLPNMGTGTLGSALAGAATNAGATAVVNLVTGQPINFNNLASAALIGGAVGAGAQVLSDSFGNTTYQYDDGSSMTVNRSGTPVAVTDNTGVNVPVAGVDTRTGEPRHLVPVEDAVPVPVTQTTSEAPANMQATTFGAISPFDFADYNIDGYDFGGADISNITNWEPTYGAGTQVAGLDTGTMTDAGPYQAGITPDTGYRVDISGGAGTAEAPQYVTDASQLTPGAVLATVDQVDSGTATWNPAANAWEVGAPLAGSLDAGPGAYVNTPSINLPDTGNYVPTDLPPWTPLEVTPGPLPDWYTNPAVTADNYVPGSYTPTTTVPSSITDTGVVNIPTIDTNINNVLPDLTPYTPVDTTPVTTGPVTPVDNVPEITITDNRPVTPVDTTPPPYTPPYTPPVVPDNVPDLGEITITDNRPPPPPPPSVVTPPPYVPEITIVDDRPPKPPVEPEVPEIVITDDRPPKPPVEPEVPEIVITDDRPPKPPVEPEIPEITIVDTRPPKPPVEPEVPEITVVDTRPPPPPPPPPVVVDPPPLDPVVVVDPKPPVVYPPIYVPPVVTPPVVEPPPYVPPPYVPPTFDPSNGMGLNPGWIAPTDFYKTYNPAQSKFSWGAHGYQPGPAFNAEAYNQAPAAATPWGLQQLATPLSSAQIADIVAGRTPAAGPVAPAATRTQAYNPASMIAPNANNVYQLPVIKTATPTASVSTSGSTNPRYAEVAKQLGDTWFNTQQAYATAGDWDAYDAYTSRVNAILNPVVQKA